MNHIRHAAIVCVLLLLSCVTSRTTDDDDATGWILGIVDKDKTTQTKFNEVTPAPLPLAAPNTCSTDDSKQGTCVKKSLCSKVTKIDPTTLFTLRDRGCHYLEECCPQELLKTVSSLPVMSKEDRQCGLSNTGALPFREKSNSYAEFGEFPWMVALLKRTEETSEWAAKDFIGGGSLIHPGVVMTAAHKVDEYDSIELKCRAGEWDTRSSNEIYPHQERNVRKIIIHPDYLRLHAHNNIALLILTQPFDLAAHIGIACLGRSLPPAGTRCFSMGWGADFNNKKKYAVLLKKTVLPLVGKQDCENKLKNTKLGSTYTLHNSLTCAGGEDKMDTCLGDGGSSLVCPIENKNADSLRYAVFGMVAYGIGCGVKDVPGVYVNLPQVYQWVGETMVREKLPRTGFDY